MTTLKYPPLNEREFIRKYLEFTNLRLPTEQQLMSSEIELIVEFVILPEDKFGYQRFSPLAKTKVKQAFLEREKIISNININNKIYSLIEKEFLRKDEDKVIYLPTHLLKAYRSFKKDKEFSITAHFPYEKPQDNGTT